MRGSRRGNRPTNLPSNPDLEDSECSGWSCRVSRMLLVTAGVPFCLHTPGRGEGRLSVVRLQQCQQEARKGVGFWPRPTREQHQQGSACAAGQQHTGTTTPQEEDEYCAKPPRGEAEEEAEVQALIGPLWGVRAYNIKNKVQSTSLTQRTDRVELRVAIFTYGTHTSCAHAHVRTCSY